jgi:ATP-binding cassette subfamily C protein LapB
MESIHPMPQRPEAKGSLESMRPETTGAAGAGAAGESPPPAGDDPSTQGGEDTFLFCLMVVARYFNIPLNLLQPLNDASAKGTHLSASTFAPAARRIGIAASPITRDPLKIPAMMLPAVIVAKEGYAAVLVGFLGRRKARVISPEGGGVIREITRRELKANFTNSAFLAQPELRLDRRSTVVEQAPGRHWFWGGFQTSMWIYGFALLGTVLSNLFALAIPLFIKTVYDRVVPNFAIDTMWLLAVAVAGVAVFDLIIRTFRGYFVDVAGRRLDVAVGDRIFSHLLNMEMTARPESSGSFATVFREFDTLKEFYTSATLLTFGDIPFVFIFIAVIWLIGGDLAIVPIVTIPIIIIAGFIVHFPMSALVRKGLSESSQKNAVLYETLTGLETIKSLGAQSWAQRNWAFSSGYSALTSMKLRFFSSLAINFSVFTQAAASIALVVFAVHLIAANEISPGALFACMILNGRVAAPLSQLAQLLVRVHQARWAMRALERVMKSPTEHADDRQYLQRPPLRGEFELRGVTFTYAGQDRPALRGIDLKIKAGERVAILGGTGSGKSTLVKLLLRLYLPDEGAVYADGTDIRQIDPQNLRADIGYVAQDVNLFYGSMRDNIVLGNPAVDDQGMLRAAVISGAEAFISELQIGYDAPIGENGRHLSGGQRQMISIARALAPEPPVMFFDEPTSGLDNSSEAALIKRLSAALGSKTVVIVTHRQSLLALVDRIVVLDKGAIIADGPKQEVVNRLMTGQVRTAGK